MGTTTLTHPPAKTTDRSGGGDFSGGRGGAGAYAWLVPDQAYRTGMWMAIAAITMLFAAFTSAMVVHEGLTNDWVPTALPRILGVNTLVLLASSGTFERARRALRAGLREKSLAWLYLTLGLGIAFIAGQLYAWHDLVLRGVFLATNPSSSFFYVLTAAHGVHLLGGIIALTYLVARARRLTDIRKKQLAFDITALYWHFMDGLWIYLFILISVRV